jgi:cold shock CspA family protein/6-pyruvoyl-tetrahydropterin synthase
MQIGLVKWFDDIKGFGMVANPEKQEFFLHINSFIEKPDKILKGTPVIFKKHFDKKKEKYSAENCRLVGALSDWQIALSYLGKFDEVAIEIEVRGRGRAGNPYHRKETQHFSLNAIAARKVLEGKSDEEICNVIIDYFHQHLDLRYFIDYCELVEHRLNKGFEKSEAEQLLNKIWLHFGNNLQEEILFTTWIKRKFKFIGYVDAAEYEIPISVLKKHKSEIGISELKRIKQFENGDVLCQELVVEKLTNLTLSTADQLEGMYTLLDFLPETESKKYQSYLDKFLIEKVSQEIITEITSYDLIATANDFEKYSGLKRKIPSIIDETQKTKLIETLDKIIVAKCSDSFKPELWIKGLIDHISFESIPDWFLSNGIGTEKRITVLSKVTESQQFELLQLFSKQYGWEKSFDLLEDYLKKINSLRYDFELSGKLFDVEYWNDKKSCNLLLMFNDYVFSTSSNEEKYRLFFKGLVNSVPQETLLLNASKLNYDECLTVFEKYKGEKEFLLQVLVARVIDAKIPDIDYLYQLAGEFLDTDRFQKLDLIVAKTIETEAYFGLWQKGKARIFPKEAISSYLADNYDHYSVVDKWLNDRIVTIEKLSDFLVELLKDEKPIEDRIGFYRVFNRIKYLLKNDAGFAQIIIKLNNDFFNVIVWFLSDSKNFNFDELKFKFIYFSPEDQVKIVQKLFYLKATNKFDLTVEKLNELRRVDLNIYQINLQINPSILLDVSTDVVIQSIVSFKERGRFLVESELLTAVLEDLKSNKTRRFKLESYFEKCEGRETANYDWNTKGNIKKVPYGNNQFYFAISFSTGEHVWTRQGERFQANPDFEELKEAVKELPQSKWNANEKHWGVPSKYETEVLDFAKAHHFFLDFEGSNYANNVHLVNFQRESVPRGIMFCEGRLANKPHQNLKKDFWWCNGQPCFGKCETIHSDDEWQNYTLLDFCEIFKFNTDETNRVGDCVKRGHYFQFIGLINRFNRLLERLYCRDCNEILHPTDTAHFAAYNTVRFHCVNDNCKNNEEIYLNHCLNGQCNSIIDSRVSKKCTNGLHICEVCGCCCSHAMLERRLNNLKANGGYIHQNLVLEVNEKLGHMERAEYYCFKCSKSMDEIEPEVFKCSSCDVKYDTKVYRIKRPHRYLNNRNSANANYREDNEDEELII